MNKLILSGNILLNENNEIFLLFRKKHSHLETPSGKLEESECEDIFNPTKDELKEAAKRELFEELEGVLEIISIDYFDSVDFIIPDGRMAVAHKFITRIKGNPKASERDLFDKDKSKFFKLEELKNEPISPDLALLLPKLKKHFTKVYK